MYQQEIGKTIEILSDYGIQFKQGMVKSDFIIAEEIYNIKFPLDYKEFLSIVIPYDNVPDEDGFCYNFIDWKNTSKEYISSTKEWIEFSTLDGVIYTIEKLNGWRKKWGEQPNTIKDRIEKAKEQVKNSPIFLPVQGNRFLALNEGGKGGSIYSIHDGIDVVPYGYNIWDYFVRDFSNLKKQEHIYLNKMLEPISKYNEFVYHSINNFFYNGERYDRNGQLIHK